MTSSTEHFDVFARLCDVEPSGRSINVCDGILRCGPGTGQPIRVDLWPTAYRFARAHRVRLQVSGGAHPRFARNLGTGEPLATGTRLTVSERTVNHHPERPSCLTLPTIVQRPVGVSRASRILVLGLLEAEVPEIAAGTVQVRAIAREPGMRTKIAVSSSEPGIDPVGACVGPKGVRHRSLLAELGNEHVDIVQWDAEPQKFVAAALGPATVVAVAIDSDTLTAHVRVPKDQLSLAIARDGQNARLAAKLTGWRVDIKPAENGVAKDQT